MLLRQLHPTLSVLAVITAVALDHARAEEVVAFPPNIQRAVEQIQATDEALHKTVTSYHKQQNNPQIERKVKQLLAARSRMVSKLSKPIEARIKILTKEEDKAKRLVDKLYEAESSLDPKKHARKIEILSQQFNKAMIRSNRASDAVDRHEVLLTELRSYEPPTDTGMPEGVTNALPVFMDGPAKGYFLHYVGKSYEALMDAQGVLTIRIRKPKSEDVYEHVFKWFSPRMKYRPPGASRPSYRKLMGFVPPAGVALKQPKKLDLRGFYDGYAQFRTVIQFMPQSVIISSGYRDPVDIEVPSELILVTEFPEIKTPARDEKEQAGSFEDYEAVFKTVKDGRPERKKLNYDDKPPFSAEVKGAKIVGPWGKVEVEFRIKGSTLPIVIKTTKKHLHEGYSLLYSCADQDIARPTGSLILTVTPPRR